MDDLRPNGRRAACAVRARSDERSSAGAGSPVAPGFWARLAAARLTAGLTQVALEQAAALGPTAVSRYESPTGPVPRPRVIARLAAALGIPVEQLRDASDTPLVLPRGPKVVAYRNGAQARVAAPTCRRGHPRTAAHAVAVTTPAPDGAERTRWICRTCRAETARTRRRRAGTSAAPPADRGARTTAPPDGDV